MRKCLIIVVTGAPGTGKTTIAKEIARKFHLPLIVKDEIKETLFEAIGWKVEGWEQHEWQKKLGAAAIEVMHRLSEFLLAAGQPHVLESNFVPRFANPKFKQLAKKYNFILFQLYCSVATKALLKRIKERGRSKDRHPGHTDVDHYQDIKEAIMTNRHGRLDLDGEYFEVDTTDFEKIDYKKLYKSIQSVLNFLES